MSQTIRNALIDAYWEKPYETYMAGAVIEAAKAPGDKFQEVCGIIARHFKGRELPNFDELADEVAKALDYREPEESKPVPLCEAICRDLDLLNGVDGEVWILAEAKRTIRQHFAALTVKSLTDVLLPSGWNGDAESMAEAAQAVMRLLRRG